MEVLGEFRKITSKPIKGIVLTHFHAGMVTVNNTSKTKANCLQLYDKNLDESTWVPAEVGNCSKLCDDPPTPSYKTRLYFWSKKR